MQTNFPKISIITPSYNQAAFLEETIRSVLDQGYPNLEYLVMDGGSTDGSVQILEKYQDRLRFVSEKDQGQTDAINKGLKLTSGEIVGYLNSDDLLEPGALLTVANAFQKQPRADWVTGQCRIVDAEGRPIRSFIELYKNVWLRMYKHNELFVTNFICQPATFWRRRVHERIGYFDEGLRYVMDYDFWLRLNQLSRPIILANRLASFRIHPASKGESQYVKQFGEDLAILKRYTSERLWLSLHRLHNACIMVSYRLLKS